MQKENLVGQNIKDILAEGLLIPVFLPIWIWTQILVDKFSGKEDMILDGVCRRKEESVALASAFDFFKIAKPNIILMNVSKDWSYTRMMERKRADDTPEEINNRLAWYEKDVVPSIEYFRAQSNYNFIEINGEQTVEAVHQDIIKALNV
jgi:adenylate kinase